MSDDGKLETPGFLATTEWLYLRLRRPGYDDDALREWIARADATGASRGFAFFKHEDEGAGPRLAAAFLALAAEADAP